MTTSRWRQQARATIEEVLRDLPPEATRKDAEALLRAASPARSRQYGPSWPYQCWLRERKRVLDARWPRPKRGSEREVTITAAGVVCLSCVDPSLGCMWCAAAWTFYRELPANGLLLLRAVEEEGMPPAILADWLEERGLSEWAGQWRDA